MLPEQLLRRPARGASKQPLQQRRLLRFVLLFVSAIVLCPTQIVSSEQGGLAGLSGLGDLTRSFFAHDAYVGSRRFYLFHIRSRDRVQLTGFSVATVEGDGWFRAATNDAWLTESIQEIWFVKNAHRFTAWANRHRIPSRPTTVFARLRYVGLPGESSWRTHVEAFKRRELERHNLLMLETSKITMAGAACAHYSAAIIDRSVPSEFDEQPFEVAENGTVCPHPDAPWLAVEVGHTQRRAPGENAGPPAPELGAFMDSLQFRSLQPPVVADVHHPTLPATALKITLAVARARSDSSEGPDRDAQVTAPDFALGQVAQYEGGIAAEAPNAIWLASSAGTVQRIDLPSGESPVQHAAACERHPLSHPFKLTAERHGVWMGCIFEDADRDTPQKVYGFTRLDPTTGSAIATVPVAGGPVDLHTAESGIWALEQPIRIEESCRLHVIDSRTNRIARTMPLRKSTSCRLLLVEDDGLWITRGLVREQLANIDLSTGTVRTAIDVPEGLSVADLVVADQTGFWLAVRVNTYDGRAMAAFGTHGGLLRIDRRTNQISGNFVPTGLAHSYAGSVGDDVWLSDFRRTIARVAMR